MGLILDTSVLIDGERRGKSPEAILIRMRDKIEGHEISISAITVVELTHGIYRASTEARRVLRNEFTQSIFRSLVVHPVSFEIAQLAGKIEGQQAAKGIVIPFQDLLIGVTALSFGFSVATLNPRHFELIPGLTVITL